MMRVTPPMAILKQVPKRVNDSLKARPECMHVSRGAWGSLAKPVLHRTMKLASFRGLTMTTYCAARSREVGPDEHGENGMIRISMARWRMMSLSTSYSDIDGGGHARCARDYAARAD